MKRAHAAARMSPVRYDKVRWSLVKRGGARYSRRYRQACSMAGSSPGTSASACTPMNAASRREKWSRTSNCLPQPVHGVTLAVTPSLIARQWMQ